MVVKASGKTGLFSVWRIIQVKIFIFWFVLLFPFLVKGQDSAFGKIIRHSHNNYAQEIPLWDALRNGFNSIEIDIVLWNSNIRVSHDQKNLDKKPLLDTLYLKPLVIIAPSLKTPLYLLIDIKHYDPSILDILHEKIAERKDYFVQRGDTTSAKPFQIIISGDYPKEEVYASDRYVFFFLDGRPSDLGRGYSSKIMPWISTSYFPLRKKTPGVRREYIDKVNQLAKSEGKLFRFWATPERRSVWKKLIYYEIAVIGTDYPKKLANFLDSI